jgi:hypothetical protein
MPGLFSFWTRQTSIQPKASEQCGQAAGVNMETIGVCLNKIVIRKLAWLVETKSFLAQFGTTSFFVWILTSLVEAKD